VPALVPAPAKTVRNICFRGSPKLATLSEFLHATPHFRPRWHAHFEERNAFSSAGWIQVCGRDKRLMSFRPPFTCLLACLHGRVGKPLWRPPLRLIEGEFGRAGDRLGIPHSSLSCLRKEGGKKFCSPFLLLSVLAGTCLVCSRRSSQRGFIEEEWMAVGEQVTNFRYEGHDLTFR